ncbi:hypothetical protein D3C80_2221930 [compost metagenome]
MVVDRRQVDLGLGGNCLVAGVGITERREQFACGFEDPGAGDGAVLAWFSWGCGHGWLCAMDECTELGSGLI